MPKEYGYVALITVFTGFISIFADAGMSYAVIRSDYKNQFQQGLKTITFYMGICLFLLMVVLAFPIAAFYNDNGLILPTIVFSSVFILRSMAIVPTAILTKELKFEFMGRRSLIITIINILFTILLAYFGFSFWSLIW
jgi:O-antigen/teichoic acid export membrane protein